MADIILEAFRNLKNINEDILTESSNSDTIPPELEITSDGTSIDWNKAYKEAMILKPRDYYVVMVSKFKEGSVDGSGTYFRGEIKDVSSTRTRSKKFLFWTKVGEIPDLTHLVGDNFVKNSEEASIFDKETATKVAQAFNKVGKASISKLSLNIYDEDWCKNLIKSYFKDGSKILTPAECDAYKDLDRVMKPVRRQCDGFNNPLVGNVWIKFLKTLRQSENVWSKMEESSYIDVYATCKDCYALKSDQLYDSSNVNNAPIYNEHWYEMSSEDRRDFYKLFLGYDDSTKDFKGRPATLAHLCFDIEGNGGEGFKTEIESDEFKGFKELSLETLKSAHPFKPAQIRERASIYSTKFASKIIKSKSEEEESEESKSTTDTSKKPMTKEELWDKWSEWDDKEHFTDELKNKSMEDIKAWLQKPERVYNAEINPLGIKKEDYPTFLEFVMNRLTA